MDPPISNVDLLHDSVAFLVVLIIADEISKNDIEPCDSQEENKYALVRVT